MIGRDMVVEAEIIEQPRRRSLKAHHRHLSRIRQDSESRPSLHINPTLTFSTISANTGHSRRRGERVKSTPFGHTAPRPVNWEQIAAYSIDARSRAVARASFACPQAALLALLERRS